MSEHRDYSTIFMQSDREMLKLINLKLDIVLRGLRGVAGVVMPAPPEAPEAPDNLPNPPARGTMGGGFEANTGG